ncbi:MAG: aminomethyl-transferring glycine dehydrogenase subunit GcvPA [Spirochaetales bacterium]|nr:aminomethyl-transferring glycine dehydrogenase subunit GcvPA [Spirochaetales bacterium]
MNLIPNPYLPHTEGDVSAILTAMGMSDIGELFADIPENIRQKKPYDLPGPFGEMELSRHMASLAAQNRTFDLVFAGAGCYDHFIPAVVKHLVSRAEFYTAYTPYQPEISQGILQGIFEFQTMICRLTGLQAANASLYDGATAAVEACAMALNTSKSSNRLIVSGTVHPFTLQVLKAYFADLDADIHIIPENRGTFDEHALDRELEKGAAGLLVMSPNIYGILEDYRGLAESVHERGGLFIMAANPMSLSVARTPARWGADIAVGDTQTLGLDMNFGGPTSGYIASTAALLRKLPGRIVGQTVDTQGRRAFVLTLQAREQHIKRQRATSNICSNQALAALASTIYLASMGKEGFRAAGEQCRRNSHYLLERLSALPGVRRYGNGPFFNEFALTLPMAAEKAVGHIAERDILAGVPLTRLVPEADPRTILIASTEKHTKNDLDRFISVMKDTVNEAAP